MAQKSFPRSLRSPQQVSQDFSLYAEKAYANVWSKGYELGKLMLAFSQGQLLAKIKPKAHLRKRRSQKKKVASFFNARLSASYWMGTISCSPIMVKFASLSASKKYNPIKAIRRVRSLRDSRKRFMQRKGKHKF
jgi:hypothetical protein